MDEFEPLEGDPLEFFEMYGLLTTGENRVSFSDYMAYFQMEEISDYEEQQEIISWVKRIERIQAKIRWIKMKKKQGK